MSKLHQNFPPDLDKEYLRQQALTRYKHLKGIKKSHLRLEERMFLENFETAMLYMWSVKNTTAS
jgi:hypothetical protein